MTTVVLTNPAGLLVPASGADSTGDMIEKVKGDCGLILQGIDWILSKITGWSPIEAILSPLAGDFESIGNMKANWDSAGDALREVAKNYGLLSGSIEGVWIAGAADKATKKTAKSARSHMRQAQACTLIGRQLGNMMKAVELAVGVVASALAVVEEIILSLTPAKWLKEIASRGSGVRKVLKFIEKAVDAINGLTELIPKIAKGCAFAAAFLSATNAFFKSVAAGGNAAGGRQTDETADAGFPA